MSTPGKRIRSYLDKRNITISDLAKLTNLTIYQIKNVLYDRTIKPDYINKIAQALCVSLETVWLGKKDLVAGIDVYAKVFEVIYTTLQHYNATAIPIPVFQEYIDKVCKHILDKNDYSATECYLKGMIEAHLKFGIICKSKDLI